jgi:hypothetical protein
MADKKQDWMKVSDNGEVTVTLTKPFEINGAKIGYIVMREPMVEDHVISNETRGNELAKEIALFSNLCTVSPADLRKLPMRDYMRLQTAYGANFFD